YSLVAPVVTGAVVPTADGAVEGIVDAEAVTAAVVAGAVVAGAVAVADGSAPVVSVAGAVAAMLSTCGTDSVALVFAPPPLSAGALSFVQPWMSRPPMKTTCTIRIVKKAMRMVDLFFEGDVPCGTSGLGVFIFCPVWFMSFVEVFL